MMKNRLTNFFFSAALIFCPWVAAQEKGEDFKVAVVDIQQVFKSYYKTAVTQKEIDRERARIQKMDNQSRFEMKRGQDQLNLLMAKVRDDSVSAEERSKLLAQRIVIVEQLRKFDAERTLRYKNANQKLDSQMKNKMRGLLEEIRTLVRAHAEAENYAMVLDRSGTNTNQVPSLLFSKDTTDITAVLMQQLNKDEPE